MCSVLITLDRFEVFCVSLAIWLLANEQGASIVAHYVTKWVIPKDKFCPTMHHGTEKGYAV